MKNARIMTKLREGVKTKDKRGMQTKAILVLGMGAGFGFSRAKTVQIRAEEWTKECWRLTRRVLPACEHK